MPSDAQGYHINNCRFIKKIGDNYFYYFIRDSDWLLFSGDIDKAHILPLDIKRINGLFNECRLMPTCESKNAYLSEVFEELQKLNPI
ncbi:hypothetical protein [Acinetobacter soli]|uniref:hypothetical protein n=1 Tax=Acinetobacter soli TaxID=487316 RepID=UPI002B319298|nr:hypothetical protein R3L12_02185 [Acinetobacter soli]